MTESDWDRCEHSHKMLKSLRASGRESERKFRLFGVACCRRLWRLLGPAGQAALEDVEHAEERAQCALVRDLFGNPFQALPAIEPSLLTYNDGLIVKLARAAYDDRLLPSGHLDPARLAVLADALEEAGFADGCADAELLRH